MLDPGPVVIQAFAERLARLPPRVRRSLSVAAADGTGRLPVVRDALALLGTRLDLAAAEAAGVVVVEGDEIAFTDPLLRSAAYHGVAPTSRRKAHQALAAVLDEPHDAEHRAWQLAAAATGPDEVVAGGLALVAERARARGAVASAAQVLEHAAALSPEPGGVRDRLELAGELWLSAGEAERAKAVLERARAAAALAALSAAERRVAMTVGAGRSNREAAEELFLSVKTVDHHLQQIYRKLAVRGRAELAVLVTRGTP